jgi:hypothetical protein
VASSGGGSSNKSRTSKKKGKVCAPPISDGWLGSDESAAV